MSACALVAKWTQEQVAMCIFARQPDYSQVVARDSMALGREQVPPHVTPSLDRHFLSAGMKEQVNATRKPSDVPGDG